MTKKIERNYRVELHFVPSGRWYVASGSVEFPDIASARRYRDACLLVFDNVDCAGIAYGRNTKWTWVKGEEARKSNTSLTYNYFNPVSNQE